MAGRDFGGEMRLRLAGGAQLTMRAAGTLGRAGLSTEAVTNQDGSVSRTATLKPSTHELTLEDDGVDVDALLRAPRQDIYIVEEFTGISHVFFDAFIGGDGAADRASGELSGLVINANGYQRLGG